MQTQPKIVLLETNQIIPDKNLFGQSNFVTNTFDVLIQLRNMPKRRSRSQATKDEAMTKNNFDNNAIIVNNSDNDQDGDLEHEELATPMTDGFETNSTIDDINVDKNNGNLNELQTNIGSTSVSFDANRRETNVMKEGYEDTHNLD